MKNKCLGLLDFLHFLLRISFCLFPWMATPILSFSRRFFSSAFNERVFLGAGLGLKRLQNHCIEVSSVRVDLCLPMQVRLSLADYFQSSVFFSGLPPLCTTLIENVRQNSLFFDIGANIGLVSIALSRFLPHDSIFAFEINPDTFFELERNFHLNCPAAHAFNWGLSDREGVAELFSISNDSGSTTLEGSRFKSNVSWHGQKVRPRSFSSKIITFSDWASTTLPGHLESAENLLFKIDVEGHEARVLLGLDSFLELCRHKRCVFVIEVENVNVGVIRRFFSERSFFEVKPCFNPDLQLFPHHTDLVFKRTPL